MGLLKKKDAAEQAEAPGTTGTEPEEAPAAEAPDELTEALFAPAAPAAPPDEPAEGLQDDTDAGLESDAMPSNVTTVEVKEEGGGDALLNVFGALQSETEDRSLIVEMVGEVDVASLVEDLRTLSSALGIARSRQLSDAA